MKAYPSLLTVSMFVAAASLCGAQTTARYGADETYRYLLEVGRVRTQLNADNRGAIPTLIKARDPAKIEAEVKNLKAYHVSLDGLDTTNVDPDAVQFKDNLGRIVDAYKALCSDTAELIQRAQASDARLSKPRLLPTGRAPLVLDATDALGASTELLGILERAKASSDSRTAVQPAMDKVRSDLDALKAAKDKHHEFSVKVKAEFADRYQGTDWTAREILP